MKEYNELKKKETTLNIQANLINEIRDVELTKSSVRIFDDNKIYSSNYLGDTSKDELYSLAMNNKDGAIEYNYELESDIVHKEKCGDSLSVTEFHEMTKSIIDYLTERLPDFIYSGKFKHGRYKSFIETDSGVSISNELKSTDGYLILKKIGSPNIMDSSIDFRTSRAQLDLKKFDQFIDFHEMWDTEVTLKDGRYPVMFTELNSSLLSSLLRSVDPDSYHSGSAFFSNELGKRVAHPDITIVDKRYDTELGIFNTHDDECVQLDKELAIVDKGIFSSIIYDKSTAKKYGAKTTGNGKRSYDNPAVNPSLYHPTFKPGNKSIDEIFKQNKKVIVSFLCGGGDTTSSGDFSSPVQLSFLVEAGEIVGRLNQITISNNIRNILNDDFIAISNDRFATSSGYAFTATMDIIS